MNTSKPLPRRSLENVFLIIITAFALNACGQLRDRRLGVLNQEEFSYQTDSVPENQGDSILAPPDPALPAADPDTGADPTGPSDPTVVSQTIQELDVFLHELEMELQFEQISLAEGRADLELIELEDLLLQLETQELSSDPLNDLP